MKFKKTLNNLIGTNSNIELTIEPDFRDITKYIEGLSVVVTDSNKNKIAVNTVLSYEDAFELYQMLTKYLIAVQQSFIS